MEGIGRSHFPVTSAISELQDWFDQGHTLLHSYEYWEAERAFRWCLKLDPECATVWWGLARAVGSHSSRFAPLLREAMRRRMGVSERERRYIEAWARVYEPDLAGAYEQRDPKRDRSAALATELERISLAYPDDVEAKALLVNHGMSKSMRLANEALLREIERVEPEHPGVHHYRIHVWDGKDGEQALESCRVYGRIAHALGHSNHMPGHVYSSMGMWHEAAIWMESATRVELAAMQTRQVFPFQYWNFPHNRNYLSYIQEQLGRPADALAGARNMLLTPRDEDVNDPDGEGGSTHRQGRQALLRCLIKFERWAEILEPDGFVWLETEVGKRQRAYAEARAFIGRGELLEAAERVAELGKLLNGAKEGRAGFEHVYREARAFLQLAQGEDLAGLGELTRLAQEQALDFYDDPPSDPILLHTALGEAYLARGAPALAAQAFEASLEVVRNDGFALSGLARARHALGEMEAAREAAGRFLRVWSSAEPGLRWSTDLEALDLSAIPLDGAGGAQRVYGEVDLTPLGPLEWQPFPAPELSAQDPEGEPVTLADYHGRNVLLVFYLGSTCVHCVEQLELLGQSADDFGARDTVLLALSSDPPETNRTALEAKPHAFRLLTDLDHGSARRFQAYDDFEELELHATLLIDRRGRVRWARVGGDPFMDTDFLLSELDRWKDADR